MSNLIYIEPMTEDVYLSKSHLQSLRISIKTIEYWSNSNNVVRILRNDEFFYLYDSLPQRTRKKLPSKPELRQQELKQSKQNDLQVIADGIKQACYHDYSKYVKIYYQVGGKIPYDKAVSFARLHSVIEYIIAEKKAGKCRDLMGLYKVFNDFFPGKYRSKHALSNALRNAAADGIQSIALDKRVFGNNNDQTSTQISDVTRYWAAGIISHPSKYTNTKIWEKLAASCAEQGYKAPSLSWVKKYRQKILQNPELYSSRYGNQEAKKKHPYASMAHAEFSMQQVQMDGWTMPFWYKENNALKRMVLVYLIDSCSKMIIGYAVGASENTPLIADAIRDAVNITGQLPFEILTDNHAFQKTMEAKYLKEAFEKRGSRFTITENPQHKAIIERYNQMLDTLCKEFAGYLGKGIRSKRIDALPSAEAFEQYAKHTLEPDEIKACAVSIINKYNGLINKRTGQTPRQLFEQNATAHPIEADMFTRADLMTMQVEKMIRRGQIIFEKSGAKHEFQLDATLYMDYNDKVVLVKYEDLKDCIYIFNKTTGEPIACLHPKHKIHGAIVNQTDEDIDRLNRHSGRLKGIKAKGRKQAEELRDKALNIDPDAHHKLNKMTTPKDVLQEMAEDASLVQQARAKGLDVERIPASVKPILQTTSALQPAKRNTNPVSVKANAIELIDKKIAKKSEE